MKFNRRKIILFLLPLALIVGGLCFYSVVLAQVDTGIAQAGVDLGMPDTDIRVIIARIIRIALGLLGIVALALVLYGGFVWMTAGGNEDKIAQAKKILVNAVIGLVIILSAYAIVSFVMNKLIEATSDYPGHCFNGIMDEGETGVDCGGACPACGGGVIPPGFGNVFYVNQKPSGEVCVRNFYAIVVFNRPVDLASIPDNLVVRRAEDGIPATGNWELLSPTAPNAVRFAPTGSCGDGTNDCLSPSTEYELAFVAPGNIRSQDGLTLDCAYGVGCEATRFVTGEGIDREPPTVVISYPDNGARLERGLDVPVDVVFTDDNGVQNISLYADGRFVDSRNIGGCQMSGTAQIMWPTAEVSLGAHTLRAVGWDYAAAEDDDTVSVNLQPSHCFNGIMDEDETGVDCGGVCGICAGGECSSDADCASGYCEIPDGQTSGVCVDRTQITNVSPLSGAVGTYVTISGRFFGADGGQVDFTSADGGWVTAPILNCGSGYDNWTPAQIVVSVPEGAADGPMRVETAPYTDSTGVERQFIDTTNDDWGPNFIFDVNDLVRPGLCNLDPVSGPPYTTTVAISGENFGGSVNDPVNDFVSFGPYKSLILNWTDILTQVKVPGLGTGATAVNLTNNGISGNSLRFYVSDDLALDTPIIHSISPDHGARGEYVTVTGENFGGVLGKIILKQRGDTGGLSTEGNFDFPPECGDAVWTDTQIIFKVPEDVILDREYSVQVQPPVTPMVLSPIGAYFYTEAGEPSPGLCRLSPVSGPIPFSEGQNLSLYGEYFTDNNVSAPYFWTTQANSPTSLEGRVAATEFLSWWDRELIVRPPLGVISGPVVVNRNTDNKISNPLPFTVYDCVANNNTCSEAGQKCCTLGVGAGICVPEGELCPGETRSTGYMWRFSTRDFPILPRVLENCNAETDQGLNFPSPSPNVKWNVGSNDHTNVCRSAVVTVGFTAPLDQATVNNNTVKIYECRVNDEGEGGVRDNICVLGAGAEVPLRAGSYNLENLSDGTNNYSYLSMSPASGSWADNTWYQVVLSDDIQSAPTVEGSFSLQADRPCGNGTAYCFVFRTDASDCRLRRAVVIPFSYWTSILEEPMRYRLLRSNADDPGTDLFFTAAGLSNQHCIFMDMSPYNWLWSSDNSYYADIYSVSEANNYRAQVSALANTVGTGLVNDVVDVRATVNVSGQDYSNTSSLRIDLSNPEVVDYWPNCLSACPNAEIGARFNIAMSNENLNRGVLLYQCVDENCDNRLPVNITVQVNPADPREIVIRLRDMPELIPENLYLVVLSSENDLSRQLWSRGSLVDPTVLGRAYEKEFSYRFRAKAERCLLDRVDVRPEVFRAPYLDSRTVYSAFAYASPDECRETGQRLDAWQIAWNWESSDPQVATAQSFITLGNNNFCTNDCLLKGSDIARDEESNEPICGNGHLEAGEDCDFPSLSLNCGLDCLFIENRNSGSLPATEATDVNASICGNGMAGDGEDCDLGIAPDVNNPESSINCSARCLHLGARISATWCANNADDFGGFEESAYKTACASALSRCGDGVISPSEAACCEGLGLTPDNQEICSDAIIGELCDERCRLFEECEPYNENGSVEGCGRDRKLLGSSLFYSVPSVCGDGVAGIGEQFSCEENLVGNHTWNDPWVLVSGVGQGPVTGEPPAQRTTITTLGEDESGATATDSGQFIIECGRKYDSECPAGYGVADDTCCYPHPNLISHYPASDAEDVCPNTYIDVVFDKKIDPLSLTGNIIVAERYLSGECLTGENVTHYFSLAGENLVGPWYKKIWQGIKNIALRIKNLILSGDVVQAQSGRSGGTGGIQEVWCAGANPVTAEVIYGAGIPGGTEIDTITRILIKLQKPLTYDSAYGVMLRPGVRDARGVSIGSSTRWYFATGDTMCLLDSLAVEPNEYTFSRADEQIDLAVSARTATGQAIQPVDGYRWNYVWAPWINDFVTLAGETGEQTISAAAKNRQGEIDVVARAEFTENLFSDNDPEVSGQTHLTVFLCENPWLLDDQPSTLDNRDFDFTTYYCADSGVYGPADDLPFLDMTVKTSGAPGVEAGVLRKYLFHTRDVPDAIGISIIQNPNRQSVYKLLELPAFQGYQKLTVKGNDAITDGNNIYIDAVIRSATGQVYSNIYLFSLNQNSGPEMRDIFEQMVENLEFNLNSPNVSFCGPGIVSPSSPEFSPNYERPCATDLDCALYVDTPYCLNAKDKITRNYRRFKDLRDIQQKIEDYQVEVNEAGYPAMGQNTYLSGQALSVWPGAWNELGSLVGVLPVDPINKLSPAGTCYLDDNMACDADADCGSLPAPANLVSQWLADNSSVDARGQSDGVIVGNVNYTPGKGSGLAWEYSGDAGSYVNIPHQEVYSSSNAFSISFWFKPTRQATAMLIKKGGLGDNNQSQGGFEIEYSGHDFHGGADNFNNGTIRFAIYRVADTPSYFAVDSVSPLEVNEWHHIAVTYNGTDNMVLSVDGQNWSEERNQARAIAAPSGYTVSNYDFKVGQGVNGAIDNLLFYRMTLNAGQIDALRHYLCVFHDSATGWSTEDFRFSFACHTESLAYRYIFDSSAQDFTLRGFMENDGLLFGSSFIQGDNKIIYDSYGICLSDDEVSSPNSLICGDGILGANEQCDPPGIVSWDVSDCPEGSARRRVCGSNCQWVAQALGRGGNSCRIAVGGTCGDGKIQYLAGEVCDDGDLNGQIWRCNNTCTGIDNSTCGNGQLDASQGELCDPTVGKDGKAGWCVGGPYIFDANDPSTYQGCDTDAECVTNHCLLTNIKYSLNREYSCNWDCKTVGPYCGDGLLTTEWNEECEGNQSCMLTNGAEGVRYCSNCKRDNSGVLDMDSLWEFNYIGPNGEVEDSVGDKEGLCRSGQCPTIVQGYYENNAAFDFSGNITNPKMVYLLDTNNNDLANPNYTWESWFYPLAGNPGAARMWEKGGAASRQGGVGLEFNRLPTLAEAVNQEWAYGPGLIASGGVAINRSDFTNNVRCLTWAADRNNIARFSATDSYSIGLNNWHHLACSFSARDPLPSNEIGTGAVGFVGDLRLYIDGQLVVTNRQAKITNTNFPLCFGAKCNANAEPVDTSRFRGTIEDVAFYDVDLSASVIQDHYNSAGWYCSPLPGSDSGSGTDDGQAVAVCGDGILAESEVCDMGEQNGVPCVLDNSDLGTRCAYCSYSCDRVLFIER